MSQMSNGVALSFCLKTLQPIRFSLSALRRASAFQNDHSSDIGLCCSWRAGYHSCSLVLCRELGMDNPYADGLHGSLRSFGYSDITFHLLEDRYVDCQERCPGIA